MDTMPQMGYGERPVVNYPSDYDPALNGIGGWLIVVIIGKFIQVISGIASISTLSSYLGYSELDSYINFTIVISIFVDIILSIVILILLFSRNILFRKLFVIQIGIIIGFSILSAIMLSEYGTGELGVDVVTSVISGAIWISYMYNSKRVKNTYIYPKMYPSGVNMNYSYTMYNVPGAQYYPNSQSIAPKTAVDIAAQEAEPTSEGAYYIADIQIPGSDTVKCPKCNTVQRNNRKCCFNCGAAFLLYKSDGNAEKPYYKKDNMGTRYDTPGKASEYFMSRMMQQAQDPGVIYRFENTEDAKNALLGIPCIKIAADTQELICTQTLNFGLYTDDACYAMLYGKDLTHGLWAQAKQSFERCGGKPHNELEPEKTAADTDYRSLSPSGFAEFVKEERVNDAAGTVTYQIYKAPDAQTAKQFLSENTVTQPLYYIIVETPDGNFGRDKDGIYQENS